MSFLFIPLDFTEQHIAPTFGVATTVACYQFHDGLLLGLFFDPEDEENKFLRSVGLISTDHTVLYPIR
jgi:hypothetical protein